MTERPNARTNPCRGAGVKITGTPKGGARRRTWICDVCGRNVALNWNGSLRWHKAEVKR
jgi:hypothetical protein